jgi:C4-dicarboxylate-specific signal transduction histidine kinase
MHMGNVGVEAGETEGAETSGPERERLEAVLDGLEAAVYAADARSDEILFANRVFQTLHGFDTIGRVLRGLVVPQPERGDYRVDPRGVSAADAPCELFDGELLQPRTGRWYHLREQAVRWVDGRIVRLGIATDITDRKETAEVARQQEERISRTARLITMGEMASMLAHEINQPLAAIANYCNGCIARMQAGAEMGDLLVAMQKAATQAERAGKIIRRIREFVKKSEPRRAPVQVSAIFEEALAFVEIDARRRGIRLVVDVAPGLPNVHADHIMIEQVVLNLVRNGFDAMKDAQGDERVLTVRARRSGERVEIAVIDRGHGISEENLERLFLPFFTTKDEGMGMGLAICRSIIEFHDGRLNVESNPEGGTMFAFTLAVEEDARE